MTGQRNENSVLFSLANLQALATGPGAGPAAAAPAASQARPGHASGEGSGLIDIRSLATATGVGSGPAMSPMARNGTNTPPQPPAITAAVVAAARSAATASNVNPPASVISDHAAAPAPGPIADEGVATAASAIVAAATLVTASSVAVAGVVGWVGLVVPHLARLLVGPSFPRLLPTAAVLGGALLLFIDTLARTMAAVEVPLGILTAVVGTPFFIVLLRSAHQRA